MHLKIALLQLLPGESLDAQLEIGTAACRQAKAMGAELALFPEMWSCGYRIPQDAQVLDAALDLFGAGAVAVVAVAVVPVVGGAAATDDDGLAVGRRLGADRLVGIRHG